MRDKSSFYLNQIYITNLNEQKTYLTNYNGDFRIPAKAGDVIRFTSIVSERKDIKLTPEILNNSRNLIELEVAYKEIQEVVLNRFKPTGNLRKDVKSLDSKKSTKSFKLLYIVISRPPRLSKLLNYMLFHYVSTILSHKFY